MIMLGDFNMLLYVNDYKNIILHEYNFRHDLIRRRNQALAGIGCVV